MDRSLVFHVILTIDVLRDGDVALNITTVRPRPNAACARAQQQVEQLHGAKKKLKTMSLDSWVAKAPTSSTVYCNI